MAQYSERRKAKNNLVINFKKLEKLKEYIRKEITKVRGDFKKEQRRTQNRENQQVKVWFFGKNNKT